MPRSHPQNPKLTAGFVHVGTIASSHGVDGRLRILPESDNPQRYRVGGILWVAGEPYTIEQVQQADKALLVKLTNLTDEVAAAVRGQEVQVHESSVPPPAENTFYHFQLIDLNVRSSNGQFLGTITEVLETGANDVYVVVDEEKELLLPALDTVVLKVSLERGEMVVAVPEGLEPRITADRATKHVRKSARRRKNA